MKPKYYITTAIAYTSGKPHIGNTYEIVLSDYLARFKRMQGFDVRFQTGTDEHGQKIEEKAKKAGKTPKQYVDEVAAEVKRIWDLMNTSYDRFIRTTDEDHVKAVRDIFKKMYEKGDIYKGAYRGWYCTECESFYTESQIVDEKCPDCGMPVKTAEEEAYFFRMSKYADRLKKYYDDNPDFIVPYSRKNEMVNNFIKPGLQDLCVSRTSFKWGIPVDFDNKHVVYVWLDALTNYITGLGYSADGNHGDLYKKYWPADVHVIGKDIVRFHTIYWPIFLMSLDLPLPKQVFGHPWLLQDGGKMSKSKGNVIYADDLVSVYGVDAVRYFLLSQMPYDNDGVINWDIVTDTVNSDLANVYGNLVSRTIAMTNKYFGGVLKNEKVNEPVDEELISVATGAYKKVAALTDGYRVADALAEVMNVFRRANKYVDETTPWILAKDEGKKGRLATVLYNLSEAILIGTGLISSFLPETAEKVYKEFGVKGRTAEQLQTFGLLPDGTVVTATPEILFARLDPKAISEKVAEMTNPKTEEKSQNNQTKSEDINMKPEISIDEFDKIELKIGKILTAEKVEKSKKLLHFTVDTGDRVRSIVSGVAKFFTPEEMVGKEVVVVANLKAATLGGVLSEGMILFGEDENGLVTITPGREAVPGSIVC